MKALKWLSICFMILGFVSMLSAAQAAVIMVPDDQPTIQAAVNAANPLGGDTIMVGAGNWAGAKVDRPVEIMGTEGSYITSGVLFPAYPYSAGPPWNSATAAFYIQGHQADGTKISQFTINCSMSNGLLLGVIARAVDNVVVDHLAITNPLQGIVSAGGKGWTISHNTITGFVQLPAYLQKPALGIALFGCKRYDPLSVTRDNLVAFNTISADNLNGYTFVGIIEVTNNSDAPPFPYTAPITENKIVHNKSAVSGSGSSVIAAFAMIDYRALYGIAAPEVTNNRIGFNDFRGSFNSSGLGGEIVALPTSLLTNPAYANELSRNLGENRAIAVEPPENVSQFKPIM